jgi:choline transport protein
MDDSIAKGLSPTTDFRTSIELANAYAVSEKHGTHGDEMDMDRMGKLQVLRVSFSMFQLLLQHTYNIISGNSSFCPSSASL